MRKKVIYLIINQQAGSGKGKRIYQHVSKQLLNHHVECYPHFTEYAGHEKVLAKNIVETAIIPLINTDTPLLPMLVVVGGDGTLHGVVNALSEYQEIPIGYIPGGSGNDFARGVGISRRVHQAVKRLLTVTEPTPIYLMEATTLDSKESRIILNNVGLGLDAKIVAKANESAMKQTLNSIQLGSLSYLSAALYAVKNQPSYPLTIKTREGSTTFERAYLCTTTNHPYFGGGIAIDPTASPFNNDIHLIVIEKVSPMTIMGLVVRLLTRQHLSSKHVYQLVDQTIELSVGTPQEGQADGEVLGKLPYQLRFTTVSRYFWL